MRGQRGPTVQFWPELIALAMRAMIVASAVVISAGEIKEGWMSIKETEKKKKM